MDIRHSNGQSAELYAAARISEKGYNILWPTITQIPYDFVAEKDGKFIRVQVKKATSSKAGNFRYTQFRMTRGRTKQYNQRTVDIVAATDMRDVWVIPIVECQDMTSVCLGSDNPAYKPYTTYDASKWLINNFN